MTLTYIRPDADDTDGTWTNESDSGSNLFASIDETSANDSDYIKSAHAPDHDVCKIRLSDPSGMVMRPATVHYRFKKKGDTSTQINLDVSLLQGSTEIAKWSESNIGTTYVDGSQALTVPQFNAISDFTNLYLQFDAFSAWWLANSSVDLSFETGLYYDSSYATATDSASLLLHMDGADASTTFIDATGRHQIIRINAEIDTAQSQFGGSSMLLNGTNAYISTDSSADFAFGTGDFTVDGWFKWNSTSGQQYLWTNDVGFAFLLYKDATSHVIKFYSGADRITGSTTITAGPWFHIALARSGGSTKLFINGTQEGSTYSDSNNYSETNLSFGTSNFFNGWMDEIRVLKGTAAWTTTFTPPTAPYNVALSGPYAHLSCSRASVGYAQTVAGTLTQFAANALRITDKGLLVEDARENRTSNSQVYGGGNYNLQQITSVTDNQTAAPDGTVTAAKLIEDSTPSSRHVLYTGGGTLTSGSRYTLSVFAKAGTRTFFSIGFADGGGTNSCAAVFDLVNGLVTANNVTAGSPANTQSIEVLANGWCRCIMSVTAGESNGFYYFLGLSDTGTPSSWTVTPSYDGNGTGYIYLWGTQSEAASFPSSYIPTTSAAATRAHDLVTCIGSLDTVLSTLPQSIVFDITAFNTAAGAYWCPVCIGSGYGYMSGVSGSTLSINANMDSTTIGNSLTIFTGAKMGYWQSSTDMACVGGGGTVGTSTTDGTAMASATILNQISGNTDKFGLMRRLTLWNTQLANATLQGFTNP